MPFYPIMDHGLFNACSCVAGIFRRSDASYYRTDTSSARYLQRTWAKGGKGGRVSRTTAPSQNGKCVFAQKETGTSRSTTPNRSNHPNHAYEWAIENSILRTEYLLASKYACPLQTGQRMQPSRSACSHAGVGIHEQELNSGCFLPA
jgi:hypothetical protein